MTTFIRKAVSRPLVSTRLGHVISTQQYSTSLQLASKLDQFRDPVPRDQRFNEKVGRSWTVKELRRKSFEDLHKLWFVLYKEKNMLLTESDITRRNGLQFFPQPNRKEKVKKSMAAIKTVFGERKREKIAFHQEKKAMEESEQRDVEKSN